VIQALFCTQPKLFLCRKRRSLVAEKGFFFRNIKEDHSPSAVPGAGPACEEIPSPEGIESSRGRSCLAPRCLNCTLAVVCLAGIVR
jgi:hypothetical protein